MRISLLLCLMTLLSKYSFGQIIDYNLDNGYGAQGYDVVAYFNDKATAGKTLYQINYKGVQYKFLNLQNLNTFKGNPSRFEPQYGGWCAYAMGTKGKKVSINPKTFEIRSGKLYLFYNSWGTNTHKSWKEQNPEVLKNKAIMAWEKIKHIK